VLLRIRTADVAGKEEVCCTVSDAQSSKTDLLGVVKPGTAFSGCWSTLAASFSSLLSLGQPWLYKAAEPVEGVEAAVGLV